MIESIEKLERIYNGWKNFVWKSPLVEELAKVRAKMCAACPHSAEMNVPLTQGDTIEELRLLKCTKCGCPASAKVRSVKETCPINMW